jgi:di/tricarboxylate transporter
VSLFAGILVALRVFFAPESAPRSRPDLLSQQRQALGPVSRAEFITLAGLAVLLGGLLLQPLLRIDAGVLAVASLVIVLAGGVLDREGFRSSIEWGLLVLFGILIGTGDVLRAAGIDRWIAGVLIPLAGAVPSPGTLILSLGLVVIAFRLVLPWVPTVLLLSLALIPAASGLGVSPWIVGFVVLTAAGGWFHPNQSEVYRVMRAATKGEMFTQRQGITLGIILTVIALLGIVISIPYWSAIGLIAR